MARPDSCWPTRAERHLLRAALLEPSEACAALDAWLPRVNLDDIEPGSRGLLPLVAANLGEALPPNFSDRLRGLRRHTWAANQIRAAAAADILTALDREGIPALTFKGLPLAFLSYPSPSTRMLGDIDVWVPGPALGTTRGVLTAAGFVPAPGIADWSPNLQHAWAFRDGQGACIDLHAHVLADGPFEAADAAIAERALPASIRDARVLVPDPADHMLIVLAHGLHWNPVRPLRWVADAMILLRGPAPIEWERLIELSSRLRLSGVAGAGLGWLERHLAADVPGWVGRALADNTRLGERIELSVRTKAPAGILGTLPRMLTAYVRSSRGRGRWPSPLGFLRYLQAGWGAARITQLVSIVVDKACRRLRVAAGLERPGADPGGPP